MTTLNRAASRERRGWPLAALERPGVHEFLGDRGADRAAALSLLLCGAASLPGAADRRLVWVQTSAATRRWGLPCGEGLESIGLNPRSVLFVEPENERELLWALEQALDCPGSAGGGGLPALGGTTLRIYCVAAPVAADAAQWIEDFSGARRPDSRSHLGADPLAGGTGAQRAFRPRLARL